MAWLSDYNYRIKFTIDNTKIDDTLTNFPVKVIFDENDIIYTHWEDTTNFYDTRFTQSDGSTELDYEREEHTESGGSVTAVYHVEVNSVSSSADTDFYMYYGKSGVADSSSGANTFDSNFLGVFHCVDDAASTTVVDATGNGNGTMQGGANTEDLYDSTERGFHLDGTDDYFNTPDYDTDWGTDGTVSLMVKLDVATPVSNNQTGFIYWSNNAAGETHYPYTNGDLYIAVLRDDRVAGFTPTFTDRTNWHHVAITNTSGAGGWIMYINGSVETTATGEDPIPNLDGYGVGRSENVSYKLDGYVAEVRASDKVREPEWIKAEYNSLVDSLLSLGSEESLATDNAVFFGSNF